jgi:o-succinylbenzoate---CoA ligase
MEPTLGQRLGQVLVDRWGEDWLIGPGCETFWLRVEQMEPVFAAYRDNGPSLAPAVLVTQPDSLQGLIACLAAWASGCVVVLGHPRWGKGERAQVHALFNPDWAAALYPGIHAYPCTVLGGQPGQILIPTGGSSGQIKFAAHTWATLMAAVEGFRAHFGVDQVHAYCVLSMVHVSGLMQALRVLVSGGCLVLQPYSDLKGGDRLPLPPGGFLSLVPTQLHDLLTLGGAFIPWLRSFRAVLLGGAPAWDSLLAAAQARGIPLAPTYGMTETAAQVATLLPEDFLAGHRSSGRPLPHAQVTILDHQGQPLPPGKPGPIALRSPSLALGYWQSTGFSPLGDCLTTDDLGYLDPQGYLHVVGRNSNKIITGGENVFPEAVEAALLAIAGVCEACVVGLPCDRWGQQLCALVVLAAGCPLGDLPDRLRPLLAPYQRPKRWIALSALPRTAQGKLSRPQALELAQRVLDPRFRIEVSPSPTAGPAPG